MVKTGRELGVFGALIALVLGYLFITAGPNIVKYGDFRAPGSSVETGETESGSEDALAALVTAAGAICAMGGLTGLVGSALASSRPRAAGTLMVAAGIMSAFTVIGAVATAAFALGGSRAFGFANAPPGVEPEWQDTESLPY